MKTKDVDKVYARVFDCVEDETGRAVPKILVGTGRGYEQRAWEAREWSLDYGNFNCIDISHGWWSWYWNRPSTAQAGREYCQPVAMHAHLSCGCKAHWEKPCPCQNVGGSFHRGMCTWCDWEGENRASEKEAVYDALDHSWPGWRDLPVLNSRPITASSAKDKKIADRWLANAESLYPLNWIRQGGPILTAREPLGTRDIPDGSGFGGYDVGIPRE